MIKQYFLLILSVLIITACQTTHRLVPLELPDNSVVITATFKHLAIGSPSSHKPQRLHVYIEGDGFPFKNRFQINQDPTPSYPLMLQLMSHDASDRLYLGRPCYFIRSLPELADKKCNPTMWTSARYSKDIVESMVTALQQYLATHPAQGITLIGHSGGGALAMLMAARMREVDQVVTLAGNLDTQAWTRLHHYTPLTASLNPAGLDVSQLPRKQLHFGGSEDDNIPPSLSEDFLTRINQPMHILDGADHNCCWLLHWKSILSHINQQMHP